MNNASLSQEEINALLGSLGSDTDVNESVTLSEDEKDTLGEIGNICMGTAATTLFTIVNRKVNITTPKVDVLTREELLTFFGDGVVATAVKYTVGVEGTNLMVLSEKDVKIITNLMMGGPGVAEEGPVTELHLSAISEVMNQMIGSTSTSLSTILNKMVDISPPKSTEVDLSKDWLVDLDDEMDDVAIISFRMEIENTLDSNISQVLPLGFAKKLIESIIDATEVVEPSSAQPEPSKEESHSKVVDNGSNLGQNNNIKESQQEYMNSTNSAVMRDVVVAQPVFQQFDDRPRGFPKENIDILMDVPLTVSVELGRVTKKIKEILDFTPGSVIELDSLIGEPVSVLVNGKFIANAEVVVIDENFGIRITDIVNPESRI